MLPLLSCMAAMLRLIPLLVVARGIWTTQKGSSERDDLEAATTAAPAASPQGSADGYYTTNVYSKRSEDTIHVGWHTRIDLEIPVAAEGFKISRLSTTLQNYVPKKELKFDIGRLRELEERARRFLPDPARIWTDDYLLDICDKQLRSYLSYVQEKEGLPYPDLFAKGYAAMFTPLFMWLVGGEGGIRTPDRLPRGAEADQLACGMEVVVS
ncbi:hypothetical protein FOZ61_000978 [Perkinsus olseni]|uniref:Uncharacterized protein n=1 Tax=Perkinsus olseni TaxID=32597 RepID=A0A7J6KSD4_PEROL|nr:hypothetical protein FOZ61_000978 [Perkinsus olseni]